jgi:hypothetical protein
MRYRNGDKFTGTFENGNIVQGEMNYQLDNESYIGDWFDGVQEGQGMFKFFNGEIYNGQWKDGLMHG